MMFLKSPTVAHKHSSLHRQEILRSEQCGCFYCGNIFKPSEIDVWTDKNNEGVGQTALCPYCSVDLVIGQASGYPISDDFLSRMHKRWFG